MPAFPAHPARRPAVVLGASAGGEAAAQPVDVTDHGSVRALLSAAEARFGPTETTVWSVGLAIPGKVHETDTETFVAQTSANLVGAHHLITALVPGMCERRRGDIVFVSTDSVPMPRPRLGAYSAAKGGLETMARTLQMELEGTGSA